jgi:MFS family permease
MNNKVIIQDEGKALNANEVLKRLGGFGNYQFISIVVSVLCLLCNSLYLFSIPFFTTPPNTLCPNSSGIYETCPYTVEYICDNGIRYKYDAPKEYNFATEFDLLCQTSANAWLTAVIFIGCLPGFLIFGFLGDIIGRISMVWITIALNICIMTLMLIFPKSLHIIIVYTGFIGFSTTGLAFSPFSIAFEALPESYVVIIGAILNVVYASSQLVVTLLAICEFTWRVNCIIIMGVFFALFGLSFVLKDPPKYQLSKRRLRKAIESFERIALINKTQWDPDWVIEVPKNIEDENVKVTELFTSSLYLWRHVMNTIIMTACGMIYYGIIMNAPNVGTSPIINATFNATAEIIGYMLGGIIVQYFSYFVCIAGGITLAGISLLLSDLFTINSSPILAEIMMYVGRFGNSISYGTVMISSDALFPPKIRNTAYLIGFGIATIGEACVTYMIGSKYNTAIDICYFVMVLAALISTFKLYSNPII